MKIIDSLTLLYYIILIFSVILIVPILFIYAVEIFGMKYYWHIWSAFVLGLLTFVLWKPISKYYTKEGHDTKKCKYCQEWYNELIRVTKKIQNKKIRDNLTELWENLWLGNSQDFDIIMHTFDIDAFLETKHKQKNKKGEM